MTLANSYLSIRGTLESEDETLGKSDRAEPTCRILLHDAQDR